MLRTLKLSVFFLARSLGVFFLFRVLSSSKVRILCYHGGCIGDENKYNSLLFCPADKLEKRIRWMLKKGFNIISLDDAVASFSAPARRPRLSTVITFDDGWYSTGARLLPVLRKWNLPSTLYLCTKHFLEPWPIPAVMMRYIIWKAERTIAELDGFGIHLDGRYDLRDPAFRDKLAERAVRWLSENFHERSEAYAAIRRFAASLGVPEQALMLESRRFEYMSRDELQQASAGACSIQLHGHVHRYPLRDPVALEDDLRTCRQTIIGMGLPEPSHYCYPSGSFDGHAAHVLRRIGVASGTTCFPGLVSAPVKDERYYLPRFLDGGDISDLEFEAEMSGFTEFLRQCVRKARSGLAHLLRYVSPRTT